MVSDDDEQQAAACPGAPRPSPTNGAEAHCLPPRPPCPCPSPSPPPSFPTTTTVVCSPRPCCCGCSVLPAAGHWRGQQPLHGGHCRAGGHVRGFLHLCGRRAGLAAPRAQRVAAVSQPASQAARQAGRQAGLDATSARLLAACSDMRVIVDSSSRQHGRSAGWRAGLRGRRVSPRSRERKLKKHKQQP